MKKSIITLSKCVEFMLFLLLTISCSSEMQSVLVVQGIMDDPRGNIRKIGVYKQGTTLEQARNFSNLIAIGEVAERSYIYSRAPRTIMVPLFKPGTDIKWSGSGNFDIYLIESNWHNFYFKGSSIKLTRGMTYIFANEFQTMNR